MAEDRTSSYGRASLLSKLTLWWMIDLFRLARKRPLTEEDVCESIEFLSAEYNVQPFDRSWRSLTENEVQKEGSLFWHLMKHFRKQIILGYVLYFIPDLCKFLTLLALRYLVEYSQGVLNISATTSWLILSGAVLMVIIHAFTITNTPRITQIIEMRMKLILVGIVYKKVLYMSYAAQSQINPGHIITLISADAEATNLTVRSMYTWFASPVLLIMILVFECIDIGASVLLTPALLLAALLLMAIWGKIAGTLRYKQARFTDKRVQLLNEIIVAMKVVKMYCWEKPFSVHAERIRRSEMSVQFWRALMVTFTMVCGYPFAKVTTFILVFFIRYTGGELTMGQSLSLIGNIGLLSIQFFGLFTYSMVVYQEVKASTERIKKFLLNEENVIRDDVERLNTGLNIKDLTVAWPGQTKGHDQFSLQGVNFGAKQGELLALVGKVGAGKSMMLLACLQQLEVRKGTCNIVGTVSYAPQEPWILSETVRDNILLGNTFNEHKYTKVLGACELNEDIEEMTDGDQTLVGERGLTLSGGQKARIGLARAVYHDADIYLLDDPLSAVDGKVANKIFFKCIQDFLKDKIRIIATHQTYILGHTDSIVLLDKGYMLKCGVYSEMAQLIKEHVEVESSKDMDGLSQPLYTTSEENSSSTLLKAVTSGPKKKVDTNESGRVDYRVYMKFVGAGSGLYLVPIFLILFITAQASEILHEVLIVQWGVDRNSIATNKTNSPVLIMLNQSSRPNDEWYLRTIGIWLGIAAFLLFSAYSAFVYIYKTACEKLYDNMFVRLIKAPLHFFETNPVGQVLNRFSRDTAFMDYYLLVPLIAAVHGAMNPLMHMLYICIVNPWCIIPLFVFICTAVFVSHQLLYGFRETKRVEASLRSPTYSHLSTTLKGLTVIRAMKKEKDFLKEAYHHLDKQSFASFNFICAEKGYALTLDLLAAVFINFSIIFLYITSLDEKRLASTGLALVYLPNNISKIALGVMFFGHVEVMMTSIERILQYGKLEQEAPDHVDNQPPQDWPYQGNISLRDVSLKYHEQQHTSLGPVNISIRPGEKIGVVGRTGAGKSSLISCLLRLVEPEGSVIIDGINIKNIGLADLRGALSVIPQDPVLFSQSLRYNLDPFDEFQDKSLWDALTKVQLSGKVKELPGQLMSEMGESASNFSVGEKQLLCLARAIMRGNKIVLIDEATANVDNRTDEMIQNTLEDALINATVITIAHRLNTLVAVDRIMVLQHGQVVEMGNPHRLLKQRSGAFYDMVNALGEAHLTQLMDATQKHMQGKATANVPQGRSGRKFILEAKTRVTPENEVISQITYL